MHVALRLNAGVRYKECSTHSTLAKLWLVQSAVSAQHLLASVSL